MIGSCSSGRPCSPGACARRCAAGQRALHGGHQVADVERLGQVLEGAALGRPHRGEQRVLRAHDDDRQVRAAACGCAAAGRGCSRRAAPTSVITTSPSPAAIQRHKAAGHAGRLHVVALARQRAADHGADRGIVLGQQDLLAAHATSRCCTGCLLLAARRAGGPGRWRRARPAGRRRRRDGRPTILATSDRPRPLPLRLVVTNGSNRWSTMSAATPGPLSRTSTVIGSSSRSRLLFTATRSPCWYWVASVIWPPSAGRRLGRVLDQVQEHLDQPVAVALDLGQRGVVELDDAVVAGEAGLGDAADMLEHLVDVDRAALDRAGVAELLHPLDQGADPVGLVADQLDQRPVLLADGRLQELGGAADAGERVLDLVRQGRGEPGDRAGRAPVRDLLVEPAGDRAGVQHHQHVAPAAPAPGRHGSRRRPPRRGPAPARCRSRRSWLPPACTCRTRASIVACGATNSDSERPASTFQLAPRAAARRRGWRSGSAGARRREKTALGMLCSSTSGRRPIVARGPTGPIGGGRIGSPCADTVGTAHQCLTLRQT